MAVLRDEVIGLRSTDDIIKARQLVRDCAIFIGLSLVDQTKVVTAASWRAIHWSTAVAARCACRR
jgi:serine/threonine-protein kinase RsbT